MFSEATLILLGVIQGMVEWLPISSSGTMMLFMIRILGLESSEALKLSILLHLGTGVAAFTYFSRDVKNILFKKTERNVFNYLIISTIVTGSFGLPLYLTFKVANVQGEYLTVLIGFALIFNGIMQRSIRVKGMRSSESLTYRDGILMGLVQSFSTIPGISRSGITTFMLIFNGFSASEALRISFLMSIPTIFASVIGLTLLMEVPSLSLESMILSIIASFISGILSIGALLRMARRIEFWLFCIILGILAITPLFFVE